jgi:uncharacterized membrane protein YedE/YeeE
MHWLYAALGGMMIGAASSLLLLTHGRIAGISGVLGSLIHRDTSDGAWRAAFIGGLAAAGAFAAIISPAAIGAQVASTPLLVIAGLLVGYGTQLGRGCTSGHGVCGLSRLSVRSLVAVATFMTTGALTAMIAGALS